MIDTNLVVAIAYNTSFSLQSLHFDSNIIEHVGGRNAVDANGLSSGSEIDLTAK